MASILDRGPDADKKMDPRNSIAADFAEDAVIHDFGYSSTYASFFVPWAPCHSQWLWPLTLVLVSSACFVIGLPVAQRTQGISVTSATTVFGDYTNYGDWDETVSVTFTFFCAVWVIPGWNAPSAVAEETHNAWIVAPRSIINTYCLQAGMGMLFCILLAFLNWYHVLPGSTRPYPCVQTLTGSLKRLRCLYSSNERWGLKVAGAFLLTIFLNTSIGGAAVLVMMSCQTAAFARDGGMMLLN
ncbi:GABA permeas UGA4 [Fusarium bulbicola]|nr:GABA permeas UGA4 [Fusarium bulbicola]